jgi:hypothetical protein
MRMTEDPGIVFRPGPTGRRAGLASGPDVWEAIRAVMSARAAEPGMPEDGVVALVAENTGISARSLRIAIRYWASHRAEVDAEIEAAQAAEDVAERAWQRERGIVAD